MFHKGTRNNLLDLDTLAVGLGLGSQALVCNATSAPNRIILVVALVAHDPP